MLSASEFTAGNISQASPLTLVLLRRSYEITMLIGKPLKGSPKAVITGKWWQ